MLDFISVIIPTHNRSKLLVRAVCSVQAQTHQDLEIIIINDASNDDTPAVLSQLQMEDNRIKVIYNERSRGGAASRNIGIKESIGKWIAFLDDDDIWLPDKLESQLKLMQSDLDAVACSCYFESHILRIIRKIHKPPENVTLEDLLCYNMMGGASVCMVSAAALNRINGFDESLKSAQDWDLWIRLKQAGRIICCKELLVYYDAHLGLRITRDMNALYSGLRHFYFKHRHLMNRKARQINLANLCYVRSRMNSGSMIERVTNLRRAVHYATPGITKISFIISSLPRIAMDLIKLLHQTKPHEDAIFY